MIPILTVTLNPALDLSCSVPRLEAGPKLRCDPPRREPGGGGTNVSRAIAHLGGSSRAFVALGGPTGEGFTALLRAEGIRTILFNAPGETRQCLSVTAQDDGRQYRFITPGPTWGPEVIRDASAMLMEAVSPGALVVLSGSHPPGIPPEFPRDLADALDARQARLVLDTSGAPLTAFAGTTGAGRSVLRMDHEEAESLTGQSLRDVAACADAARQLVQRGAAGSVIIAFGAHGSILAEKAGAWHARPPKVTVRSRTGAGDSFVAALTLALATGEDMPTALRQGTAAAASAVMTEGSALCRHEDFVDLLPRTQLTALD